MCDLVWAELEFVCLFVSYWGLPLARHVSSRFSPSRVRPWGNSTTILTSGLSEGTEDTDTTTVGCGKAMRRHHGEFSICSTPNLHIIVFVIVLLFAAHKKHESRAAQLPTMFLNRSTWEDNLVNWPVCVFKSQEREGKRLQCNSNIRRHQMKRFHISCLVFPKCFPSHVLTLIPNFATKVSELANSCS